MTLWSMTVITALQTNINASGADISAWLIVRGIFFDGGQMRIITDKAKNEIGKRLSAIYYIALYGYGKDTASDIESTSKIIEHLYEIADMVGGERFSNYEMPAYVVKLHKAIQRKKEAEAEGE